ncbi:hypothetical protein PVIIG_05866 [Plasmodium vivax India VII]|uniref:PIR Superfamily Protein n=1 Tax=Plasmodium vivax India VII TaxID=1077284 RepID=A0A0J9UTK4_PLAVI|nr:hypothetical protein PVIIG_05866 [Plasmodium vivax India VII]
MVAIMLNIFDSNIIDIHKTLTDTAVSIYMPGLNFVCECFKIYKDRHNTMCLNIQPYDEKQRKTCDKLGTFENTYRLYLLKEESLVEKIPSFVNIEDEYKTKCKLPEQIPLLVPRGVQDANDMSSISYDGERRNGRSTLSAGADENADGKLSLDPNGQETTGSPISSTISTAVGTMAGASSVLALLYKVNNNFI